MNKKKIIIFYSINPVNYVFAFIFNFFFPVYYWRKFYLSEVLLKNFNQLYEDGSFDMQEWHTMISPIFRSFRQEIERKNNIFSNKLKFDFFKSDLMPAAMQEIALDYEKVFHFFCLIDVFAKKNKGKQVFIIYFNTYQKLKSIGINHTYDMNAYNLFFKFNVFLENILEWFYTFSLILRNIYFFVINIPFTHKMNPKKILFYKFSTREIGHNVEHQSIIHLIKKQIIKLEDCVFYIYGKIDQTQKDLLKINELDFVNSKDIFKIISKKKQIQGIIWTLSFIFPKKNDFNNILKSYLIKPLIKDINIFFLSKQLNVEVFVNSAYGGITETPIVSILKADKLKTVFWYYYNMGYKYFNSNLKNSYNFELIEDCFSLSEFRYLWSEIDVNILKARNLNYLFNEKINFVNIGPVMLGNNRYFKFSPQEVRKLVKFIGKKDCKIWITIFDVATFYPYKHTEHRWPIGNHSEVSVDKFFNILIETMKKFPDVGFLYKPKRSLQKNNLAWKVTNTHREFIKKDNKYVKNGQLVILENNVDPYLPILLCDHAVGMTFTSAITATNYFKRNSVYLDLSRKSNSQIYPETLNDIIITKKSDFFAKVHIWRKKKIFLNSYDPIERFNLQIKKLMKI